jgi:antitoxin ParD1/3/4
MSSTPTRNFSLTAELDNYIRAQVSTGRYSNASEVVRAAPRLMIEREQDQAAFIAPKSAKVRGA